MAEWHEQIVMVPGETESYRRVFATEDEAVRGLKDIFGEDDVEEFHILWGQDRCRAYLSKNRRELKLRMNVVASDVRRTPTRGPLVVLCKIKSAGSKPPSDMLSSELVDDSGP